jgi:hypothetical protein
MALTALTVTDSSRSSVVLLPATSGTVADVANGNSFANNGNVIVLATNTGATVVRNVTIPLAITVDSRQPAARTYAIAIGTTAILGPFDTTNYGSTVQINGDNVELKFNCVRPGIS